MQDFTSLTDNDKNELLNIAKQSISHGFNHNKALPIDITNLNKNLQNNGASFVTLKKHKQLRGCIGSLSPYQSLAIDVSEHAFMAAFKDHRFSPLTQAEYEELEYHISVLGPNEPINFTNEQNLLSQLQPNIDGLILQDKNHRSTFLPSVWQQLPNPSDFLEHLKLKAGLSADYWSDELQIFRYKVIEFGDV